MNYKLHAFLFLALTRVVFADNPPGASGFFFRTVGIDINTRDLFYVDGGTPKPISVDTERRSGFYEYKGGEGPLTFVKMVAGPDGKKVKVPVVETQFAAGNHRMLFIFHKVKEGSNQLGVVALSDEASEVPPGGHRVVNFLPVPVGVIIGDKKQIVAARGSYVEKTEKPSGGNVYNFKMYVILDQSALPVYSNVWGYDDKKRSLVIIAPSREAPDGVEVKYMSESIDVAPVEGAKSFH